MRPVLDPVPERTDPCPPESVSIADLFLAASRELASSDARLYRSLDKHFKRTRELLSSESEQLDTAQTLKDSGRDLIGASSYERQTRSSLQDLCKVHGIDVSFPIKTLIVDLVKRMEGLLSSGELVVPLVVWDDESPDLAEPLAVRRLEGLIGAHEVPKYWCARCASSPGLVCCKGAP